MQGLSSMVEVLPLRWQFMVKHSDKDTEDFHFSQSVHHLDFALCGSRFCPVYKWFMCMAWNKGQMDRSPVLEVIEELTDETLGLFFSELCGWFPYVISCIFVFWIITGFFSVITWKWIRYSHQNNLVCRSGKWGFIKDYLTEDASWITTYVSQKPLYTNVF